MEIESLLDVVRRRRSTRGFVESEITDEQARAMVEAARFAPCGANSQPWEFIFVRSPERKEAVMGVLEETRRKFKARHPGRRESSKKFQHDAAALVVVLGDPRCDPRIGLAEVLKYPDREDYTWEEYMFLLGMGASIQNLLLAATAMGIGSVWLTSDLLDFEDGLKRTLGVPEHMRLVSLIALGKPRKEFPVPYKRDVSDLLHFDGYEMSKMRAPEEIIRRRPVPPDDRH